MLAGSAAYAVTESFRWRNGMDLKVVEAREFYGIIALATLGGVLLDFAPVDPIKALVLSAQINGVIAVPIMTVMMMLAHNRKIMGKYTLTTRHTLIGWFGVKQLATLKGNGRVERARVYVKDQLKKLKLASIEAI